MCLTCCMAWKLGTNSINNLGITTMPDIYFPKREDALRHAVVETCNAGIAGAASLYDLLQQLDKSGDAVTTPPRYAFDVKPGAATSAEIDAGRIQATADVTAYKRIILTFTGDDQYLFYRDYPLL